MDIVHYADSGWSVVPPLLAVALAIITRRVLVSLGVGIVAGSLLLNQFSPLASLHYMLDTVLRIFWVSHGEDTVMPRAKAKRNCLILYAYIGCPSGLLMCKGSSCATFWVATETSLP